MLSNEERTDGIKKSDGTDGYRRGVFIPGTARPEGSGKKAGTVGRLAKLREFAEKLGFDTVPLPNGQKIHINDPAEALMYVALVGRDPLEGRINEALGEKSPYFNNKGTYVDSEGGVRTIAGYVSLDLRLDCMVKLLPYMRPKLASMEMTGKDGTPLFEKDKENASKLSRDPEIRKLFEAVQEKMEAPDAVEQITD